MKKTTKLLALVFVLCFALSACGANAPAPTPDPEPVPDTSGPVQVVNPVREATMEEQLAEAQMTLNVPQGGTETARLLIDTDGDPVVEVDFTLDGAEWFYRVQNGEPTAEELSGMYYEWTNTQEVKVDYCNGVLTTNDKENVACLMWRDIVVGVTYTLSTVDTSDIDTVLGVANLSFETMQGDSEGDPEIPAEYQEIIDSVQDALSAGSDMDTFRDMGVSYLFGYPADPEAPYGYSVTDVNEDGIPELILGSRGGYGMIFDMFTIEDGHLLHVLSGEERNRFYLCEGGYIRNESSDSAFCSADIIFTFEGGPLHVLHNVIYDSDTDPDNPWFYRSGDMDENDPSLPITEEEANEKLADFIRVELKLTDFAI